MTAELAARRGRRRAGPGGMRRAGRLRELLIAGVVDSFGMALGWTVVVLIAVTRGGLTEAALYNAAMLVGAVLSAPVTGWLARRFDGRALVRGSAAVEVVLRFAVLGGLIAGAPSWSIAAAIVLMHTAAWAGFAGMRAEVSAVNASPQSMTRYVMCIMGVEAAGTALAALLPLGVSGYPTGWLLGTIFAIYLGSLLPTFMTARRARISPTPASAAPTSLASVSPIPVSPAPVSPAPGSPAPVSPASSSPAVGSSALLCSAPVSPAVVSSARPAPTAAAATMPVGHFGNNPHAFVPAPRPSGRGRHARAAATPGWRLPAPQLVAGGAVMLIASGPALLAVPLIEELYGGAWVAASAVAFCLGTLFATKAVTVIARLRLPAVLRWSLWGLGMLAGWTLAPLAAPMVLLAQFAAGLSQTAFEGDMDAKVAAEADTESVTRDLAYAASVRALGGAVAVRMIPMLIAAPAIGLVASVSSLLLGITTVIIWTGLSLAPHLFRRLAH